MIRIESAIDGRFGVAGWQRVTPDAPAPGRSEPGGSVTVGAPATGSIGRRVQVIPRWMYRGYTEANASDLAAAVAFNALVSLVPMVLLFISVAGLFLKNDYVLGQVIIAIATILPSNAARDAFNAAFQARGNSGLFGVISLVGFAWIGTGFISCLARSMNRIYGVRNSGYINEKQRGFFLIFVFGILFVVSVAASVSTTFFVSQDLPLVLEQWLLASGGYQILGYLIGYTAAFLLFLSLYRVIPNAGQTFKDIWLGTITSSILFTIVTLAFPIYIRTIGGVNRYGQVLGLVSLLVLFLFVFAHIILFGAYINATYQRHRRQRLRLRRARKAAASGGAH